MLFADRCLTVVGLRMGQSRSPYSTILIAAKQCLVCPESHPFDFAQVRLCFLVQALCDYNSETTPRRNLRCSIFERELQSPQWTPELDLRRLEAVWPPPAQPIQ